MEKTETSEYCSLRRRCAESFAICVRVDAEWKLGRIPKRKSGCESHRSRESAL